MKKIINPNNVLNLVRRITPNLISNKIITTQPMAAPNNNIYHFNYQYEFLASLNRIGELPPNIQKQLQDCITVLTSQLKMKDLSKILDAKKYKIKCIPKYLLNDSDDSEYFLNGISEILIAQIMIILGGEIIIIKRLKPSS